MLYRWMKDQGLNVSATRWIGRESWFDDPGSEDATVTTRLAECDRYTWEEMRVKGFAATQLREACREVTASPAWMFQAEG